jgi:hypothetical protein
LTGTNAGIADLVLWRLRENIDRPTQKNTTSGNEKPEKETSVELVG